MPNTVPYGLPGPDDNAFVVDGPAAIRALAEAVDNLIGQVVADRDTADAAEAATRAAAVTAVNARMQRGAGNYTVSGGVITITYPTAFAGDATCVPISTSINATFRATVMQADLARFTVRDEGIGALLGNGASLDLEWLAIG